MERKIGKTGIMMALLLIGVLMSTVNIQPVKAQPLGGEVGYWMFEEGEGTSVRDSSIEKNDGVLSGTPLPIWTVGRLGKALAFNGGYVEVADKPSLDLTDSLSLTAWIAPHVTIKPGGSGYYSIISKWNIFAPLNTGYFWIIDGNTGSLGLFLGFGLMGVGFYATSNRTWNIARWYHIAVTYDKSLSYNNLKIYINGCFEAAYNETRSIATNDIKFLVGSVMDGYYGFKGAIDDVRVYRRALSGFEVKQLANLTSVPALSPLVVSYYTFVAYDCNTLFYHNFAEYTMETLYGTFQWWKTIFPQWTCDMELLVGSNATKNNFENRINSLKSIAQSGELVAVFLSGHGDTLEGWDPYPDEPDGKDEYALTFSDNWECTDDNFTNLFRGFNKGVMLLFVLDICFADGFTDGKLDLPSIDNPHAILVAGKGYIWNFPPFSGGYTAFGNYLINGLKPFGDTLHTNADTKGNDDGITTAAELFDYARGKSPGIVEYLLSDSDGDGKYDEDDVEYSTDPEPHFLEIDNDGDGLIDEDPPLEGHEPFLYEHDPQPPPPPSPGVGGFIVPINKLELLAPYIGLASISTVAAVATAVYVKRVKRRKEKQ